MEDTWTPDSASTVEIDPSGDALLIVGPCKDSHVSLLVSSKVLSLASSVFKVMFGPHFKEGQTLREDTTSAKPLQIRLPDDDLDGMKILCNYLHYQHASLPDYRSSDEVMGLALMADKYDCAKLLAPIVCDWMKSQIAQAPSESQLCDLLALACLFDDPWSARVITAHLLLVSSGGYRHFRYTQLGHRIPKAVLAALARERNYLRQLFADLLNRPIRPLLEKDANIKAVNNSRPYPNDRADHHSTEFCLKDALIVAGYTRELNQLGLGKVNWFIPLRDQLAKLAKFNPAAVNLESELDAKLACCKKDQQCTACRIDFSREVNRIISDVLSGCTGVCLDCVLAGWPSQDYCRIDHEPLLLHVQANDVTSFARFTAEDIQKLHLCSI